MTITFAIRISSATAEEKKEKTPAIG